MKPAGFSRTEFIFSLAIVLSLAMLLFGSSCKDRAAESKSTPPPGTTAPTPEPNSTANSSPGAKAPRFAKQSVPPGSGAFDDLARNAQLARQATNGKILYTAMVNYAGVEDYPIYKDKEDPTTKVADSSDAFEILLKGGYLEEKKLLFNPESAWCRTLSEDNAQRRTVLHGENDWCYVVGLNRSTARSSWPILVNAFSPGTTYFVSDPGRKGGVYGGTKAVVVYCGGNVEIVDTLKDGDGNYIVRRLDKPEQDAFVSEGNWLEGPNVKVLYPRGG